MRLRCEVAVPPSTYSAGGRCQKKHGVKKVKVREGTDTMTLLACTLHRRMVSESKPIHRAPKCSTLN